jgi:mono/diheme cytochrome c family protein
MMRALLLGSLALALGACDWSLERMADQPRCEPGDVRPWLPGQRCDQRAPEGTITWRSHSAPPIVVPRSRAAIARGADRYRRICAPCHGALGDAQTAIARDMTLRPPPSLHTPLIVGYPDQRLFEVISQGYGMMPSYDYQLVPEDRWAVVQYVRVLQRSQATSLAALPPARSAEAQPWLK